MDSNDREYSEPATTTTAETEAEISSNTSKRRSKSEIDSSDNSQNSGMAAAKKDNYTLPDAPSEEAYSGRMEQLTLEKAALDGWGRLHSKIGFYEIFQTIGTGSFAIVRKARHRLLKSVDDEAWMQPYNSTPCLLPPSEQFRVAVKIIDKTKLDTDALLLLKKEVEIMKSLEHPYIIKLHQVIEDENKIYLFQELAENGELYDAVANGQQFTEDEARIKFWHIISAVEYLHNKGIVHRDLKLDNLLLDKYHRVKLSDFGFSDYFQENSLLTRFCGSPQYSAPEIFQAVPYNGPRADIWSLGVVLYAITTGSLPFEGQDQQQLGAQVKRALYRVPFYISISLADLIQRMLKSDPKQRITIAEIKKHRWMQDKNFEVSTSNEIEAYKCLLRGASQKCSTKFLINLGIRENTLTQAIAGRLYDHTHGMYNLLMEKYRKTYYYKTVEEVEALKAVNKRPILKDCSSSENFETTDSGISCSDSESSVSRQSTVSNSYSIDEGVYIDTISDQSKYTIRRSPSHNSLSFVPRKRIAHIPLTCTKRPVSEIMDQKMQSLSIEHVPKKRRRRLSKLNEEEKALRAIHREERAEIKKQIFMMKKAQKKL